DCQYASGGAPAHALILLREHVRITKGAPKEHWSLSAKGNRIAQLFCEHCGTPLFARNEAHPEFLPVKIGSLEIPQHFARRRTFGCVRRSPGTTSIRRFPGSIAIPNWDIGSRRARTFLARPTCPQSGHAAPAAFGAGGAGPVPLLNAGAFAPTERGNGESACG